MFISRKQNNRQMRMALILLNVRILGLQKSDIAKGED